MRFPIPAILLLPLALLLAPAAAAQQPERPQGGSQPDGSCYPNCGEDDEIPPDIDLAPLSTTIRSPLLTVGWCDNASLDAATRWITVNGNDRTASFTWESGVGTGDCNFVTAKARSQGSSGTLNPGNNTVEAHICDNAGNCTTETFTVFRDMSPTPLASLAPHRGDLVDYGRCAMGCFAATHAQGTVPYFTLNTPRSVTLTYNSDVADPRPFVHVDVTHGGDLYNLPDYFTLKVQRSGGAWITFLNGEAELRFTASSGAALRLSGQFDAAANGLGATQAHSVTVIVGAKYGTVVREVSLPTRVVVVNESTSPVARGWMLAGVPRLYVQSGGILVTEGDGSASFFATSGGSYVAPAGDLTRLVTGGPTLGAAYTRFYPDSTRVSFNSGGRAFEIRDRLGNTTGIVHDGNGRPWKIQDPT
jgi:hypothetical protein